MFLGWLKSCYVQIMVLVFSRGGMQSIKKLVLLNSSFPSVKLMGILHLSWMAVQSIASFPPACYGSRAIYCTTVTRKALWKLSVFPRRNQTRATGARFQHTNHLCHCILPHFSYVNERAKDSTNEQTKERPDRAKERTNDRTNERTDGRTHGQTDGRTDERTNKLDCLKVSCRRRALS